MDQDNEKQLVFLDCEIQDKIWAVGRDIPAVFSIDKDLSVVHLQYILKKKMKQESTGLTVKISHEYLYVFLEYGSWVYRIDKRNDNIDTVDMVDQKDIPLEGVYEYNRNYYMIPSKTGDPLLKFDGESVKECTGWKEQVKKAPIFRQYYFTLGFCAADHYIWSFVPYTDYVVRTDLRDYNIQYWRVGTESYRFETIGLQNGFVWLVSREPDAIVCWDVKTGIKKVYTEFPLQLKWGERYSFAKIVSCQGKIFFVPGQASDILVLDQESDVFQVIKITAEEDTDRDEAERKFFSAKLIDDKLYLFAYSAEGSVVVDTKACKVIKKKKLGINRENFLNIQKEILQQTGSLREDRDMGLEDYLKIL